MTLPTAASASAALFTMLIPLPRVLLGFSFTTAGYTAAPSEWYVVGACGASCDDGEREIDRCHNHPFRTRVRACGSASIQAANRDLSCSSWSASGGLIATVCVCARACHHRVSPDAPLRPTALGPASRNRAS